MYVTPTGVNGPSGREIVFLGRPAKAREVVGRWSEIDDLDGQRYDAFFEETAEQLQGHFEVRTLPIWMNWVGDRGRDGHYVLSWNNCLVQNNGNDKRVLLPYFADPKDARGYGDPGLRRDLQQAARAEWEGIGFRVTEMDGLEDLATGLGSVHCITKTLAREATP
jgi:hypothetical protein